MYKQSNAVQRKLSATFLAVLIALMSVTLTAPMASAVGANQNDLGSSMDLPDNSTSINSSQAVSNLNGLSPIASGPMYGELDVGDDQDWFAITINANEGVTLQLSYNTTYNSSNGSSYSNAFDLFIFDASLNLIDFSYNNNPEIVSTNASQNPHGGTVYVEILRYAGYGSYTLDFWTFSSSTSGNGTGGNGTSPPTNCVGNGTTNSDILEPNDSTSSATMASNLPVYCTGLSIDSTVDEDYFEIDMISGITYYVNLTFTHANGDIDGEWTDASGSYLSLAGFGSLGSGSDNEAASFTATSSFTSYLKVYLYSFGTSTANVYDIELSTDQSGGGQSFESIEVNQVNLSTATIFIDGLTAGTNYTYNYSNVQYFDNGTSTVGSSTSVSFNATGSNYSTNVSISTPVIIESNFCVESDLMDASSNLLNTDFDCIYLEILESEALSSTTGKHTATNLSLNTDYTLWWFVYNGIQFENNYLTSNDVDLALAASMVYEQTENFTSTSTSEMWSVNWTGITTADTHVLVGLLSYANITINLSTNEGYIGFHASDFIPQLPSMMIDAYSTSSTAVTNNVDVKGSDLVTGDSYRYQVRVVDQAGANIASSTIMNFTASAQNMSMPTFTYSTPNMSGVYCAEVLLYSSASVQLVGDSDCFNFFIDDDNDGVANEFDLCPNSTAGAMVDMDGCELSQKDSDSDGYNDDVDDFPYDSSQYSDMDGDGYGDNANGNSPDAFPTDSSQWSDIDGDGYGDNTAGNASDAFPYDPTQWSDADGDGYGDNATGNNADEYPTDPTQWADDDADGYGDNPNGTNGDQFPNDGSQWSDTDGDGYGDNLGGNQPDIFPTDSTQWVDADGDGYGDNAGGNDADLFPDEPTQWFDQDGDGFGDNQAGNNPDHFPTDGTQWQDADGDGYGDNPTGNAPDAFPADATQWMDADYDGYGDNAMGNDGDQCLGTPAGQAVNTFGCSPSQLDDDLDGVANDQDACPETPAGESVDMSGCSGSQEDADNDGVMDAFDLCPLTVLGATIDAAGCSDEQLDSDDDGVTNDVDECPMSAPDVPVNGQGCAASERDTDMDNVMDADDFCPMTPETEEADSTGCSDSQRDDDNDSFNNDVDACPNTALDATPDASGCSPEQYDDDDDQIDNTIDDCPATPLGEQVGPTGCSETQTDQDMDGIKDAYDECRDTGAGHGPDLQGCSEHQKDDDEDGVFNVADLCKGTDSNQTVIDDEGCGLNQIDTDGDGVNDEVDDFVFDANETLDSDGDGVSDRFDDAPFDATRSEAPVEENGGGGLTYAIIALLVLCGLGALLVVRQNESEPEMGSAFAEANYADSQTESQITASDKSVPTIGATSQEWEEDGVNWSKSADGTLSYYDAGTESWIVYDQ